MGQQVAELGDLVVSVLGSCSLLYMVIWEKLHISQQGEVEHVAGPSGSSRSLNQ